LEVRGWESRLVLGVKTENYGGIHQELQEEEEI
jgi:hypothetical protein